MVVFTDQHFAFVGTAVEQVHIAQGTVDKRAGRVVPHLLGRADLFDFAAVHQHHAVGHFQSFFLVVGHEDAGHMQVVVQTAQPAAQFLAHLGVQRAEGLVQQQHFGFHRQCTGQGNALTLTAGQLRWIAVCQPVQLNQAQQFVHFFLMTVSLGRRARGFMRKPKATLSNTVMWRNRA